MREWQKELVDLSVLGGDLWVKNICCKHYICYKCFFFVFFFIKWFIFHCGQKARHTANAATQTNFVYLQCKYTVQGAANPHHMGPTHCNFRKHWTCETHWETARKALDAVGSWSLCGRFVFHCLCSLWKHFLCGLLLSSARHNLQFTSYYFILLLFLCVMHFVLFACVLWSCSKSRSRRGVCTAFYFLFVPLVFICIAVFALRWTC